MTDLRWMISHRRRTQVQWRVVAFLVLVSFGCGDTALNSAAIDDDSPVAGESHVVVRVQPIERRQIAATVTALGQCEAPPDKLALLTPAVEGQVSALLLEQGHEVEAGQPIVQLDDTLAQTDLAEKEATRDSLVAALHLLESVPRTEEQQASKLAIEHAEIAVAQAAAVVARLQPLRSGEKCRSSRCTTPNRRSSKRVFSSKWPKRNSICLCFVHETKRLPRRSPRSRLPMKP